ncbi:MAG: hypothetical protein CM1200mP10_06900 [Candidatus Neomarinimicrobiota bacterium]|nr:MAG: hypothetical protein CM1200mP10_06900 [Candidatus Neomarinimicrobiota bacterium]
MAQAGDTVMVMTGEYSETLMIDKSNITLWAQKKNNAWPILMVKTNCRMQR